jgi:hypothetical protein
MGRLFCSAGVQAVVVANLKFINGKSSMSIRAPKCCHYVALNYIWGPATEDNAKFSVGNYLKSPAPMTIEDSITVTLNLGY